MTANEWVDLIIRRGPELRAAGVVRISSGGCSAVISPLLPELAQVGAQAGPATELDPLEDPITFGGGQVPGYQIPEPRDNEEQNQ